MTARRAIISTAPASSIPVRQAPTAASPTCCAGSSAGRAAKWPRSVPIVPAKPEARVDGLRITMVGHASLLIQAAGCNILTDPVWSERASPFRRVGPKRVTAPGIAFDDLPPIDVVLLSHGHYDHLDVATLQRLHAVARSADGDAARQRCDRAGGRAGGPLRHRRLVGPAGAR